MKKIIFLFVMVPALLLTSPVRVFALGNDFTFSNLWFSSVISETLFTWQGTSGSYRSYKVKDNFIPEDKFCSFGETGIVGTLNNPSPFVYYYHTQSSVDFVAGNIMTFTSPLGVSVKRGQTINLQSMLFCSGTSYSNLKLSNVNVRFTLSDGTYIVSVPVTSIFSNCSLGTISLNSNGIMTGFNSEKDGYGNIFDISWTNNTDSDLYIKSVRVYFQSNQNISNFYYGFFTEGNKELVALPSYVEDTLSMISSGILQVNDNIEDALNELEFIKGELISIAEKLNQSGSTTNNYYQTITQPSEGQLVKQEQLEELVESAKTELAEMKEVMQSVTVPSSDDVLSVTTSPEVQVTIDNALDNTDVNNILKALFDNSIIVTMLLSVVSIATVGYILYGKR